jgi:hypothetical protein
MSNKDYIFRSETSDDNNKSEYLFDLIDNNKSKLQKSKIISSYNESDISNDEYVYNSVISNDMDNNVLYEDFYDNDSKKENIDNDKYLFDRYFNLDKKQEKPIEIRYLSETNETDELFKLICKNNFYDVEKYFKKENTIFKNKKNKEGTIIIKSLCVRNNCLNLNPGLSICKLCYKTPVYSSFKNTNRGIKTIYNYLLRLLIVTKQFRVFCECCKNKETCIYLNKMNEYFENKKDISSVEVLLSPKKKIELEINFYINKFMKILNFLKCECKFSNYSKNYYSENFFNFSTIYEIYLTTIPNLIKLLKEYFSINENNEELYLVDDSRCIHEDIQYYGLLTYCTKKKENKIDLSRYQNELIMKIENVHKWLSNSLKINILMINEQSLELFNYELLGKNITNINYQKIFEKLYSIKNIFINLDHKMCNENIVKIILKSTLSKEKSIEIINNFTEQYILRKNINEKNGKNFEESMINYARDCIEDNNYCIGIEFLKIVKKSINIPKTHQMYVTLKCIFNKIINTNLLSNDKKISFLKIINKNKINVSEYDFVSNLIDYEYGDDIILGFDKYSNNLFKINDYNDEIYIKETIKNCMINFKPNIMDYVLHNLDTKIELDSINPINIYLTNIKKINSLTKKIENENKYINILEIILKYEKIKKTSIKYFLPIQYCITNNLTQSAKLFIRNKLVNDDEKLILECILKNNHIIAECLIQNNPELIKLKHDKLNLINIIFKKNDHNLLLNENIQIRFIKKIINPIVNLQIDNCTILNDDDDYNESFGFLLLSSDKISTKNKIYLINFSKNHLDPMKINYFYDKEIYNKNTKNIPLILYSYLLNEYEITYILLNSLIRHDKLEKIRKDNNSIFNNYCKNIDININIIPIIIKYLRDNHDFYYEFDENTIDNNILDIDKPPIVLILICLELLCGYIQIKLKYNKINKSNDVQTINNIKKYNIINNNKYKEIAFNNNKYKEIAFNNNKYKEIGFNNFNNSVVFDTDNNFSENNINSILLNNHNNIKYNKIINTSHEISDNNSYTSSDNLSSSPIMRKDVLF